MYLKNSIFFAIIVLLLFLMQKDDRMTLTKDNLYKAKNFMDEVKPFGHAIGGLSTLVSLSIAFYHTMSIEVGFYEKIAIVFFLSLVIVITTEQIIKKICPVVSRITLEKIFVQRTSFGHFGHNGQALDKVRTNGQSADKVRGHNGHTLDKKADTRTNLGHEALARMTGIRK